MRKVRRSGVRQRQGLGAGVPERSDGERSEPARSGGTPAAASSPDPEVSARAKRRRFTGQYKLRILEAVASCKTRGEVGEILRREGLYSSHLTKWREQRAAGELEGLSPKKRGPAPRRSPEQRRIAELERHNERLQRELEIAQTIIDVQKKVATLLGVPLATTANEGGR
jgi:transposase